MPTASGNDVLSLDPDDRRALEDFVADADGKLAELEANVGRFNLFDALGIVQAEIKHSNFLAWLLDPAESHGLGGLFLRAFLMDLLRNTPVEHRLFSPIRLDGGELQGIELRREWQHLDILIVGSNPRFAVAIENKITAGKYNDFPKYRERVEAAFPDHRRMYVLLTPDGDEMEEHEDWVPYSYADLHTVLTRVRTTHGSQMGDDVRAFLDHYLRLIRSRLMQDETIETLCREIYKNHRRAIDLILEHTKGSEIRLVVPDLIMQHFAKWHLLTQKQTGRLDVKFQPMEWLEWLPAIGAQGTPKGKQRWISYAFVDRKDVLFMNLRIFRTEDPTVLKAVAERLYLNSKELGLVPRKLDKDGIPQDGVLMHQRIGILPRDVDGQLDVGKLSETISLCLDRLAAHAVKLRSVLHPYFTDKQTN